MDRYDNRADGTIKFILGGLKMQRAISKETSRWEYGTYFDGFILKGSVIDANNEFIAVEEWHPVRPETLCNTTGTFDMLGNEVYENDILHSEYVMHGSNRFIIKRISIQKGYGAYTPKRPGMPHQLNYILSVSKVIGNTTIDNKEVHND